MFKAMTEDANAMTPRRNAFDEALVEQTIEDTYGHTAAGLERQSAVMRDWLLDDDADLQLIDDHGVPLLERHPIVNADRGNDADIEELAASMEAKGWCEGVGGVPFAVRQEGCRDARKMLMIGGASRVEAWVKAYRRNPTNKKLLLTSTKRLKHCHVYKPQTPLAVLKWLNEFHNSYHIGLKRTLREALSDAKAQCAAWTVYKATHKIKQRSCGKGAFSYRSMWSKFMEDKFRGCWSSFNEFFITKSLLNAYLSCGVFQRIDQLMKEEAHFSREQLNTTVITAAIYHGVRKIVAGARYRPTEEGDDDDECTAVSNLTDEQRYERAVSGSFMVQLTMEVLPRKKGNKEVERGISITNPKPDVDLLFANISGCRARMRRLSGEAKLEAVTQEGATAAGKKRKDSECVLVIDEIKAVIDGVLSTVPHNQRDMDAVDDAVARTVHFVFTGEAQLRHSRKRPRKADLPDIVQQAEQFSGKAIALEEDADPLATMSFLC